jgi:S-(hydroxymethyl)glutathione synthase
VKILETEITMEAAPQTVWSILDDIARYPEWNSLVRELHGLTIMGETVTGRMVLQNTPEIQLAPVLTRIVGGRELRWITTVPGEKGFTAEHYFILTPTANGGTHLVHNEIFDGPGSDDLWGLFDTVGRTAYNRLNVDLQSRAAAFRAAPESIHPCVEGDRAEPAKWPAPMMLRCLCPETPVEVRLGALIRHNHLCGCSKCWKPAGALFAQTAVVPAGMLEILKNGSKLAVVDASQKIQRHACSHCGTHLFGQVKDKRHHFYGLDFIHPELGTTSGASMPEFAGFVSSIIQAGTSPSRMAAVRSRLKALGVPAYDAFSPEIMDIIAWHHVKVERGPA